MTQNNDQKAALDDLTAMSQELGLYSNVDLDTCEIKDCKDHGWLTRIGKDLSRILCDSHYEELMGEPRKTNAD